MSADDVLVARLNELANGWEAGSDEIEEIMGGATATSAAFREAARGLRAVLVGGVA